MMNELEISNNGQRPINISIIEPPNRIINHRGLSVDNPTITDGEKLVPVKSSLCYRSKYFFINAILRNIRYLLIPDRSFIEKFIWISFTSVVSIIAGIIIFNVWENYRSHPIIIGLDNNFNVDEVAFPFVAVCPLNAYDENKINSTSTEMLSLFDDKYNLFESFLRALPTISYSNMKMLYELSLTSKSDWNLLRKPLRKYILDFGVQCESFITNCRYKDEPISCCDYFNPVITEHGYCLAFNSRFIDKPKSAEQNTKLNYIYARDKEMKLHFELDLDSKIFIHNNEENSGLDFEYSFEYKLGYKSHALTTIYETFTTDYAKTLPISRRKCIFPDEGKLKYYDGNYTFTGCMHECRIDNVLQYCKCIPPFYKPMNLKYCGMDDLSCLAKNADLITDVRKCQQCESCCYNTVYDIEKLIQLLGSDDIPLGITIEFVSWPVVRYKREVLYGLINLLIAFGEILRFFLGFSLLSCMLLFRRTFSKLYRRFC